MKTKEKVLEERKCVVCGKKYLKRTRRTSSRKYKKGREYNALYTCSKRCAFVYNGLYMHFRYLINKRILVKVGNVIDSMRWGFALGIKDKLKQKLGIK